MPRKPKPPQKKKITVPVKGRIVEVTLLPPCGSRKSWYAYWSGLKFSRSTGQTELNEALNAVHDMLQNGGRKSDLSDIILTDSEFDKLQEKHYSKKTDPQALKRSLRSLTACMEAVTAFRQITELSPISLAKPEDCEKFQHDALKLAKDWRVHYANNRKSENRRAKQGEINSLSSNTVVKWSVALKAAFERANRNSGQKCVRGVVPNEKLLTENPWSQFTWIEGSEKPKRHFNEQELMSLLEYFEKQWVGLSFAPAYIKVCLWSWARREEISNLKWDSLRNVGREVHFDSVGKWGVRKWFRLPENLVTEIEALKNDSPFVFGCYPKQLKAFHIKHGKKSAASNVRDNFCPENLGEWMYRQVRDWSKDFPRGSAYLHIFRKTSLRLARKGEDLNRLVATDASLTSAVMTASYTEEDDEEFRHKSNRTYNRILKSLPVDVAIRYGYVEKESDRLIERLDLARTQDDWKEVAQIAAALEALVTA